MAETEPQRDDGSTSLDDVVGRLVIDKISFFSPARADQLIVQHLVALPRPSKRVGRKPLWPTAGQQLIADVRAVSIANPGFTQKGVLGHLIKESPYSERWGSQNYENLRRRLNDARHLARTRDA